MVEFYRGATYVVTLEDGGDKYKVTNLNTGVVEYENTSLPRCLITAEESDWYFEKRKEREEAEAVSKESSSARIVKFPSKDDPQ